MNASQVRALTTRAMTVLGLSADEVADSLRAKDIKGSRGAECLCPIAVYLGTVLPDEVHEIEVHENDLFIQFTGPGGVTEAVIVPTTDAVAVFLPRFDQGVYLDLATNTDVVDGPKAVA